MKKLVGLGFALALLTLATPVFGPPGPLIPYCWNVEGNSCSSLGQTTKCTDGCGYIYTCTCISWGGQRVWDCPTVC
jgi:hypothetical protein